MTKVGLLFPGQGSQYVGMAKALTERYASARRTFEEAGDCLGWDVLRLCLEGDKTTLTATANAQPHDSDPQRRRLPGLDGDIRRYACRWRGHSLGNFPRSRAAAYSVSRTPSGSSGTGGIDAGRCRDVRWRHGRDQWDG